MPLAVFDFAAWAGIVLVSVLGGVAILWIVGGYYHLRYYVGRRHEPERWKCQPQRFLRPEQQRQAMLLSTMNLAIGGFISGTFIYALTRGFATPIYFDVAERGWLYTLGSTVLLFVLVDALAYYAHRALHAKSVFRYVHRWHHRYIATTPFVVTAMHPVEFLVFQAVTFAPLFVIPFHYVSVVAVFVYVLVFNIIDHSGVRLSSALPWQGPSSYHDDHHTHFHCNFGQHLMLWDRLHGTLRREDRRYGETVFGGRGEPDERAGARKRFVRY
jgi:Delta7-sterol 5-desaturase